ncbi:MAG: hypothetical protein NC092_14135 [Butyrivibrio sp.]|nr:hypothetical protein [Muribaculum sp.]MCM1553808.1 hypothetical protein [Butyrivibrio sp.]
MDSSMKTRLLYELNMRQNKLELAISQMEHQLTSVNTRLDSLRHDLALYAGMVVVPPILYLLLGVVTGFFSPLSGFLFLFIFTILQNLLLCGYIIFLPFNIYYLLKTFQTKKMNDEPTENITELPREGTARGEPQPESTYRSEQQKLVFILSRYYLYQDTMNQLKRRLDEADCSMTLAELHQELEQMPFYEEIRPARPVRDMSSGMRGFLILLVFAALILLIFPMWM